MSHDRSHDRACDNRGCDNRMGVATVFTLAERDTSTATPPGPTTA